MSNVGLFKNFTAGAAISPFRIVRLSAAETVVPTAAMAEMSIGVVQDVAPLAGERVDVALAGIALVEAGGAIALGALVSSDPLGRGITISPPAGVNARAIGVALDAAVAAGDQIRILIGPCSFQG